MEESASDDQVSPIFYKQQALDENEMANLNSQRTNMLLQIQNLSAKSKELHSQSSALCVQRHREELKKLLSDTKSKKLRKIAVPEEIFEPSGDNKLTVVRLYDDWHTSIEGLVAKQIDVASNLVENWFEFLNTLKMDENDPEEATKEEEEAEDYEERKEYEDVDPSAVFLWFTFFLLLISMVALVLYSFDGVGLYLLALIDYLLNQLIEFYVQMYNHYLVFHSMELSNVTHEILVNT